MAIETETDTSVVTSERARVARATLTEAALLGLLADGALRNAPGGLGWTIWVFGLAFAALNIARRRDISLTREQIAWLAVAIACAAAFAWHDAEELQALNVFGTLVALAMFSMAAAGLPAASILVARVRDVLAAGVYTVRDIVFGAPMLVASDADLLALPAFRGGSSWTALRALLITTPLVLVFVLLLSRADPVFASVFRLPEIDAERVIEHVVLIGAFTWWSAGYIRGALLGVSRRPALPERMPVRLGLAEITTSFGAVIALFALFVVLQLRWLFGGADVVLATTGLTVAEYARRGFFELVAVTALVLPVLLVTRAAIVDESTMTRHRLLSTTLLVLLAGIMTSAFSRMALYVSYYGISVDRLYASVFMGWLVVVLATMAVTVLRDWTKPFAAVAVISGFAALGVLNVMNPEAVVARSNVARGTDTPRGVDYVYLAQLSGDAMPIAA